MSPETSHFGPSVMRGLRSVAQWQRPCNLREVLSDAFRLSPKKESAKEKATKHTREELRMLKNEMGGDFRGFSEALVRMSSANEAIKTRALQGSDAEMIRVIEDVANQEPDISSCPIDTSSTRILEKNNGKGEAEMPEGVTGISGGWATLGGWWWGMHVWSNDHTSEEGLGDAVMPIALGAIIGMPAVMFWWWWLLIVGGILAGCIAVGWVVFWGIAGVKYLFDSTISWHTFDSMQEWLKREHIPLITSTKEKLNAEGKAWIKERQKEEPVFMTDNNTPVYTSTESYHTFPLWTQGSAVEIQYYEELRIIRHTIQTYCTNDGTPYAPKERGFAHMARADFYTMQRNRSTDYIPEIYQSKPWYSQVFFDVHNQETDVLLGNIIPSYCIINENTEDIEALRTLRVSRISSIDITPNDERLVRDGPYWTWADPRLSRGITFQHIAYDTTGKEVARWKGPKIDV